MIIIGNRWVFLKALIEGNNPEAQRVFTQLSGLIFVCPDGTDTTHIPSMSNQESELDFGMWASLVIKDLDGKGMKEVLLALFYDMEPEEICLDPQCQGICCSKGLHIPVIRMVSTEVGVPVVPPLWPPVRHDHKKLVEILRSNVISYTKFISDNIQDRVNYIVRRWPLLREVNEEEKEIVCKLKGLIKDPNIKIHGSASWGGMRKTSDIDLLTDKDPPSVYDILVKSGYNAHLVGSDKKPRVSVTIGEKEFDITYINNLPQGAPPPGIFDKALKLGISKLSKASAFILSKTISCVSDRIRELIARDEHVDYKGVPSITTPLILLAIAQSYSKDFTSFNLIQDLTKIWHETLYTSIHFRIRKDGYIDIGKFIDYSTTIGSRINVYHEDYQSWNMGLYLNKDSCISMERGILDDFNLLTFRSKSGIWELRTLPPPILRTRVYCKINRA